MDRDRRDVVARPAARGTPGAHVAARCVVATPSGCRRRPGARRRRSRAPVDRLDHAAAERQVGTNSSTSGMHSRHRTMRRRCRQDGAVPVSLPAVPAASTLRVLAADDRLDHAIVAVVALVDDRDLLGLGAHEDEEAVAELLHPADRVLLEHRLDREALGLDDPALARRARRPVGDPAEELLLLDRPGAQARLLAVVDRAAFDLVDDLVERGLVARAGRVTAQRLAVDDERDLGDVGVRRRFDAARWRARRRRRNGRPASARAGGACALRSRGPARGPRRSCL